VIKLVRTDGNNVYVNPSYIVMVEETVDEDEIGTRIVLHDGRMFRVANDCPTVLSRIHLATQ